MLKRFFLKENILLIISLTVIFIFATSCEDDPIAPQEEHVKAIGMVFYTSGIEVARIEKGVTSDTLIAPLNGLSDRIYVKLIDEDGDELLPSSSETETLNWEVENSSIAVVWQPEGEEGSFQFFLEGYQLSETEVELFVMHGDHSDFRSGKIPLKVENQSVNMDLRFNVRANGNILHE